MMHEKFRKSNGDIVIVRKDDYKKARYVLPYLLEEEMVNGKKLLLIGGHPGTGKTELQYALRYLLHEKGLLVQDISLDDYFKVLPENRTTSRKKKGISSVGHREIDWVAVKDHVHGFYTTGGAEKYEYNIFTKQIELKTYDPDSLDVLIVEGLYALYLKKYFKGNRTLGLHIEATLNQTYKFRKKRDKENPDDKFRKIIVKKESEEVNRLKKYADIIIPY